MAVSENIMVQQPTVALPFGATLVDGQADIALPSFGGGVGYVAPTDGFISAISVSNDVAQGAGALSFDVKIGSVQQEINLDSGVADTAVYLRFSPGQYKFAAGDLLGVTYTSGVLTVNGDVSVALFITLNGVNK